MFSHMIAARDAKSKSSEAGRSTRTSGGTQGKTRALNIGTTPRRGFPPFDSSISILERQT
jgi:hypothetical protein